MIWHKYLYCKLKLLMLWTVMVGKCNGKRNIYCTCNIFYLTINLSNAVKEMAILNAIKTLDKMYIYIHIFHSYKQMHRVNQITLS